MIGSHIYGIILFYWDLLNSSMTFFNFASFQWFKKLENIQNSEENLYKHCLNWSMNRISQVFETQVISNIKNPVREKNDIKLPPK